MKPYESQFLRSKGNLGYLDFIRLLSKMWTDAHPDIPLIATSGEEVAQYPCIVYRLDMRRAHPSEPKMKFREEIITKPGEDAVRVQGQRFQNIITFTAFASVNPHQAEEIIEVFEDFMIEFTPIFKELGASELVYARRLPDGADQRPGIGVVERTVSYMLTTEKIIVSSLAKLDKVMIDARIFLENPYWVDATPYFATPNISIVDNYIANAATPQI